MGTSINEMVTNVVKPKGPLPTTESLREGAPKKDKYEKLLEEAEKVGLGRLEEETMSQENKTRIKFSLRDVRGALHNWRRMKTEEFNGR